MRYKAIAVSIVCFGGLFLQNANSADGAPVDDINAWIDVRASLSSTGHKWLDGGSSKTRYGSKDDIGHDLELADISVLWTPTLSTKFSGHLHFQTGPDQNTDLGVVEAFLKYRARPVNGWRISTKAGRFFPPVSFEHDGPGWSLTRTLTPSAINSWIGEEIVTTGVEARMAKRYSNNIIDFRGALFGYNDPAGALLAYRGWAMHDIKSVFGGEFTIPQRISTIPQLAAQAPVSIPSKELDDSVGYYASTTWRYSDAATTSVLYYDNNSDPTLIIDGQYGWDTKFLSLGTKYHPTESLEFIAQFMTGVTKMGTVYWANGTRVMENEFDSAFILGSYQVTEKDIISCRLEKFSISDRTTRFGFTEETGHSLTSAWRRKLSPTYEIGAEVLYVDHDRFIPSPSFDQNQGFQIQWMVKTKL